jgi:NAD(P)H-dependent FMN reductase
LTGDCEPQRATAEECRRLGRAATWHEFLEGKPGFITGTSPGALGSALVQQHLCSVMTGLGMVLLGGEVYVTFKPNLIDDQGNIGDEGTRKFLQEFVNRFATLIGRLSPAAERFAALHQVLTESARGSAIS